MNPVSNRCSQKNATSIRFWNGIRLKWLIRIWGSRLSNCSMNPLRISSHFHGPMRGGEMHIVLLDNGRSDILGSPDFRRSLSCIRCGACMNTRPVYRRSGGHSYKTTIPGPIGSILVPSRDPATHHSLPFACSLCGSCSDVCPVKIDLHTQLLTWRREIAVRGHLPWTKRASMKFARVLLGNTWLFETSGRIGRWLLPKLPRFMVYNRFNAWGNSENFPRCRNRVFVSSTGSG